MYTDWYSMKFTPCLALILISSVIGVYNLNLEEKINNSNCYLSQRKVELFSNVQTLQKYSIKKLDKMSFQTLFKNCKEHDLFLFCPKKGICHFHFPPPQNRSLFEPSFILKSLPINP